jgi:hypothetical protein
MHANRTLALIALTLGGAGPAATAQTWLQTSKVFASDGQIHDRFRVPALDGDTLLVGAHDTSENGTQSGSVYAFDQVGGGPWTETATLVASDASERARFGHAVAVDGDTAVIGAPGDGWPGGPGAAYVFERVGGNWFEAAKLVGSGTTISFGEAVTIDGDTVVVGAPGSVSSNGSIYVYERDFGGPGAWGEWAAFNSPGTEPYYGQSVSLSGDTLLAGAPSCCGSGEAFLCERDQGGPGAWGIVAQFPGPPVYARFGAAVAVDGDTAAIGATREDPAALYVFERDAGGSNQWGPVAKLGPSVLDPSSEFGDTIAVSGDAIVCGAWSESTNGMNSGSAYVYERHAGGPGIWAEVQRLWPADPDDIDWFGRRVTMSGHEIACGATRGDGLVDDTGAVYVHRRFAPDAGVSYCTAGTSTSGCRATMHAFGTPSASASDGFALYVDSVEGVRNGIFFWGTLGRQAVQWGNGTSYRCVVPPVSRATKLLGVGSLGACTGLFGEDLNALWYDKPWKNPGSGAVVQAQLWYRDQQNTGNKSTSFSDAVEFTVLP